MCAWQHCTLEINNIAYRLVKLHRVPATFAYKVYYCNKTYVQYCCTTLYIDFCESIQTTDIIILDFCYFGCIF